MKKLSHDVRNCRASQKLFSINKSNTITDHKWRIYNSGDTLSFFRYKVAVRQLSVSCPWGTELTNGTYERESRNLIAKENNSLLWTVIWLGCSMMPEFIS